MITINPASTWRMAPDGPTLHTTNVHIRYQKAVVSGVSPFETAAVVDMGSSRRFSGVRINECQTLTKTRAGTMGYWCSLKGGPLDIDDMSKLQGFEKGDLPWSSTNVSTTAPGALRGHAQSLNLVERLLPHVLFLSWYITGKQCQQMCMHH